MTLTNSSNDVPYALKYRPTKLSEVIGQPVTVQALTNAFKAGDVHHAFILGGNLGCGKTTLARIMAAMDSCQTKGFDPCGKCSNCKEIFAGKSIDIKEIDAASNRGIENIRNLKKECQYHPVNCRMKYFIIDEAHALTGYAAEAALKIIEEPPAHVRFVLCTTAPHLIKDTIHSRCIYFKFNKVSWNDLHQHLVNIAKEEDIAYSDDALQIIAKSSSGSVRNALQNLQSVVSYAGGEKLTDKHVREILGLPDERLYFELIDAISKINVYKGMQTIVALLRDGRDAKSIIDGLELHLRNIMLMITCQKHLKSSGFLEEQIKRYEYQVANLTKTKEKIGLVLQLLKSLYDINRGLVLNLDPQILLERYLIEAIITKRQLESAASG